MNKKMFRENKKLRNLAWQIAKDGKDWKERYDELSQLFCRPKMRIALLKAL